MGDLGPMLQESDIIAGDVVGHTSSGRTGAVLRVRHCRDETSELLVQLLPPTRCDEYTPGFETWWSSSRVRRVRWRDPYRRYLAMCRSEARTGRILPGKAWESLNWRLNLLVRDLPGGTRVVYDLGRDCWRTAALDCLDRRDRVDTTDVSTRTRPPVTSRDQV